MRQQDTGSRGGTLTWRAGQLADALEHGGAELDPVEAGRAQEIVERVGQRWALKGGRTVVALAGATGSGKSSLFNALAGEPVAGIGVRRPTTDKATAAIWGAEPADELLDWLGVHRRHHVTGDVSALRSDLDGLVLIDLPDFDSTEVSHRIEADRVLERADVFVWVTDPQKYADARLHEDYLSRLRDHSPVMLMVLNQVDRVPDAEAVAAIRADLARLVAADGAGDFEVLATSARIGTGLDELTDAVGTVVATRSAAQQRLTGDLAGVSRTLLEGVGEQEPELARGDAELVDALKQAAGVPVVLDAVRRDYARRAMSRTGWPVTRWLSRLRPDPLRRLRLGGDTAGESGISVDDVRTVLGRSSLPPPTPAARSAVHLATRRVGERAGEGLPPRWAEAVAQAATPADSDLADSLDQAVMRTPLRERDPLWWPLLGSVQLLLALAAVAGALWLTTLAVLGWLQISVDPAMWGPVPIPALLLVGGLALGFLLGLVARAGARVGARRRRRLIESRLESAIAEVADQHVRAPVAAVLERHSRTRAQLQAAGR